MEEKGEDISPFYFALKTGFYSIFEGKNGIGFYFLK